MLGNPDVSFTSTPDFAGAHLIAATENARAATVRLLWPAAHLSTVAADWPTESRRAIVYVITAAARVQQAVYKGQGAAMAEDVGAAMAGGGRGVVIVDDQFELLIG